MGPRAGCGAIRGETASRDRGVRLIAGHAGLVESDRHRRLRAHQRVFATRDSAAAADTKRARAAPSTCRSRSCSTPSRRIARADKWLGTTFTVRSSAPLKRMRVIGDDNTVVQFEFLTKGAAKSAVAVQHQKLPDRSAVDATKKAWAERFDRLGEILS